MRKPTRLFRAESRYSRYCEVVSNDVTIDDVLDGSFWCNVGNLLQRGDAIEVRREDGAWEVELRVIRADKLRPTVELRSVWERQTPDEEEPEPDAGADYEVSFAPRQKWRVVDKAAKAVLAKDFGSKAEAIQWAEARNAHLAA
jgi:hypothetical protein